MFAQNLPCKPWTRAVQSGTATSPAHTSAVRARTTTAVEMGAPAFGDCFVVVADRRNSSLSLLPACSCSSDIVAANRRSLGGSKQRHGLWPAFTRDETVAMRFDKCAQDRHRQAFMGGFGHIVELGRKPDVF